MSDELVTSSNATGVAPLRALAPSELITRRHSMFPNMSGFSDLVIESFLPGESPHPYGFRFDTVIDILEEPLSTDGFDIKDVIEKAVVNQGELTIFIAREHIVRVARHLRDDNDLHFKMCLNTDGVYYPSDEGRELHAIYPFWSITHNRMIRLEVTCPDTDPHIPSIMSVYPGNDQQERGTWDFIGIVFDGHPSLTRTALSGDQVGYPQCKDCPFGGILVGYKGATITPADTRRSYR